MSDPLIKYLHGFAPIPEAEQALISEAFQKRSYREGDYLFRSGHICKERFFICSGILRIPIRNEKGTETTHYFLKENQFCTILKSFDEETVAEESIRAAVDTETMAIHKTQLMELYKKLPWLRTTIDQITQQALLEKINIRNAYLGMDAAERYRTFLARQPEIASRVSLTDIASYLGITPQSLSRIRKHIRL
jgi:CRP-like cAMP-binding protein